MGSLKPNSKIIYESPDSGGTVYGRYAGTNEKWVVGYSYDTQSTLDSIKEDKLWSEIRQDAKSNKLLQEALDRAIMIYHLSKNNDK